MKEQMTLGELITALKRKDPERPVYFDFVHFQPKGIHSYRGYYDQLAIGYNNEAGYNMRVSELLPLLRDALGATFQGYKGGDYVMSENTPVWVANYNEAGSTAIVDVVDQGWRILLETASVD